MTYFIQVCGITNRTYTYHQLYKYSRRFAAKLLTQFNIREDDVTCIMMSNNPEYAVATLGSLEAGATVTTINPIYTVRKYSNIRIFILNGTSINNYYYIIICLWETWSKNPCNKMYTINLNYDFLSIVFDNE